MRTLYLAHIADSSMRTLDAVFALDAFDSARSLHASRAAVAPGALQNTADLSGDARIIRVFDTLLLLLGCAARATRTVRWSLCRRQLNYPVASRSGKALGAIIALGSRASPDANLPSLDGDVDTGVLCSPLGHL